MNFAHAVTLHALHPMLALGQPTLKFSVQMPLGDFWKKMGQAFLFPSSDRCGVPASVQKYMHPLSTFLSLWFSSCANLTQTSPLGSGNK